MPEAEVRKFQRIVEESPEEILPNPAQPRVDKLATDALMLGLKTLGQRALSGARSIFTLCSVASAWWLWAATPSPDVYQIVSLTIYAVFILAMNWIVWKK